jgi:hypothetical protein
MYVLFSCSLIWNQQFIYEVHINLKLFLFIKPWLAFVTQITVPLPLKQPMRAICTSSHRFNFFRVWTWLTNCLTFWHQSFTFNSNKSPTWSNNFPVYYPDVCLQFNMFRAFSRPFSGAQRLQWQLLVLPSFRGDSRAVFEDEPVIPARPQTQHDCHHDKKVKPVAATAVIELLMMGGKMHETCWAVNKRQDNKLKNCCIRLVIYLNCTMMHRLTNLKF